MTHKYNIIDIEKGINFLKKHCQAVYVQIEIEQLGRMIMSGSDLSGNRVTITIYEESTQKMPDLTRTERL